MRAIAARMAVRCFEGRLENLETFAGAASRADQRVIDSATCQEPEFSQCSFDVEKPFAKGFAFGAVAKPTGAKLRVVESETTAADAEVLRTIP